MSPGQASGPLLSCAAPCSEVPVKSLHRPDLFGWSSFDEARNVDFNGTLLVREGGNVAFDPMPPSDHDFAHIEALGGVAWVLITNSDHGRDAEAFAQRFGASIAAPAGDRPELGDLKVDRWLEDDDLIEGVSCIGMRGSKTPGELAFQVGDTLITGDLVRGQHAGSLNLLPDLKLADKAAAIESVRRLVGLGGIEAVLVGDGQSIFRAGHERLVDLLETLS